MEQRAYQKWTRGLLLGLVLVLMACAAVVYRVDPCFYYRMPTDREPVFFSERYQTAGIVRNNPADVVLLGSSMTANCYGSQLETVFGGTGLRLTIPDGYFSEFDQVMGLLMRTHPPKRVLFAMDTNIFTRSPDGVTGAMPDYLYDASTINDVKYLLNKDVLYYSLYALMAQRWDEGEPAGQGIFVDGYRLVEPHDRLGGIYPAGHRAGADAPGRPAGGRRQKSGGCGKLGGAVPGGGI